MSRRKKILMSTWIVLALASHSQQLYALPQQDSSVSDTTTARPPAANSKKHITRTSSREDDSYQGDNFGAEDRWSVKRLGKDFQSDQKAIWTSPATLRFEDTTWIVPFAGGTAGLFVTDREYSKHLSTNPQTIQRYRTLANGGTAALAGAAAGLALLGKISHDEHKTESGFLSGEAALDSLLVVEALKFAAGRERPYQGTGAGQFRSGGSSFPSEHAAATWAIAGILAHEYPGPLSKFLVYGLASAVSLARVKSRDHFASDVLVGGGIGWLTARHVYSKHHDRELPGIEWNPDSGTWDEKNSSWTTNSGSSYVPMDSWIYPALDRLIGFGLINSGFLSLRPWTRTECARLIAEVDEPDGDDRVADATTHLLAALRREFRDELTESGEGSDPRFRIESVYTRIEDISGQPINGYDFAQTQINDFGRPYAEGWNSVSGFSMYANKGPWVAYLRAEEETAPGGPVLPLSARQFIAFAQSLPGIPPAVAQQPIRQFELLEAYVGLNVNGWQLSFGPQSLWWGPAQGGPLLYSTNSRPITMFRANRVSPINLPLVSRWLGPMRVEAFFGQVSGQEFVGSQQVAGGSFTVTGQFGQSLPSQPFLHGEKFAFKPTRNFEFSFSRTGLLGGPGVPLTLGVAKLSYFGSGNGLPGSSQDPGDRRTALDWTYRLPRLRDWITFYGEAFTDDQFSPIAYFDRSAIAGGLFFSHLPKVAKLDLRVEGVYTDVPAGGNLSHGFFYSNTRFLNGYTTDGNLIGSWIGRQGQGAQAWSNYWLTARNRIQFNFRHQKVSQQFIPGGGTLTDAGIRADWLITPSISLTAQVQQETWNFPVIRPGDHANVSTLLQITFAPGSSQLLKRHYGSGQE